MAVLVLAALVWGAAMPGHARAQDAPSEPGLGEIQIDVLQLGLGGQLRPGSWAGVQVRVNDLGLEQRNVVLRVRGTDADGDHPLYDRVVTTNPGTPQAFWVYMRVPYQIGPGDEVTVRVHEAIDAGSSDPMGFRAGRILGSVTEPVGLRISATDSVMGVVDQVPMGLTGYQTSISSVSWPAAAHDIVWIANDLRVPTLPDRWQGLAVLDALVWGSGSGPTDPGLLTPEQALAIERWVERGGHLIIVLPSSGQEWTGQASNRLRRLLPAMEVPFRHEGVDLGPYRDLFTSDPAVPMPEAAAVHELTPLDDAEPGQAVRVLHSPEGWCIAMRRSIGSGAVTVVGVDLSAARFRNARMPEADVFWHRVLGRRGPVFTEQEIETRNLRTEIRGREAVSFDDDLDREIDKTSSAVQGVLFGLVLFVLYWVVAGPAGYIYLAKRKRKHLSWPIFVATTAAFTLVAWTGAAALRPKRTTGSHVTYLEQVHGQEVQRARSWVSVLVPRYGSSELRVGEDPDAGHLIAPWSAPGVSLTGQTFPDNRGYRVSAREPASITVPTRQTVKQVQVDWAGPGRLGGIRPMAREIGGPRELRLVREERGSRRYVDGVLVHDLPDDLEDVLIVVVEHQSTIGPGGLRNGLASLVNAYKLPGAWAPDIPLDLADGITRAPAENARSTTLREDDFLRDFLREGRSITSGMTDAGGRADRLLAVRFFSQFPPAELNGTGRRDEVARRVASQGWDLGRWFTQPCVIVVGHLRVSEDDASAESSPVPLFVDGREIPMAGRTVVSWVYPLPDEPPRWAGAPEPGDTDEGEG